MVLYLTGVLKMKGNENVNRKSPVRLFFAAVFFVFTAYCGYGLLGYDLKQFSGFLPPNYYSWFEKKNSNARTTSTALKITMKHWLMPNSKTNRY